VQINSTMTSADFW